MYVTIYRGTKEIGGNCVEVGTSSTRLIIDVGLPLFDADRQPLDSRMVRRRAKEALLAEGIVPQVPGLFVDGPPVDAILLSHAHMDHTGLLDHSLDTIPVYATTGTSKMMHAGALFAGQVPLPRDRFRELSPMKPVEIGDFTVTPFAVDHSIYGCLAFLIQADGKSLLYSGDLRLHGRKPGMARDLLAALQRRSVDVLLMEGTHIGTPTDNRVDEYDLEADIVKILADSPSLVLASFSPQHVDRLVGFIRAAKKTRRTFVVDVYTAYVMYLIHGEVPIPTAGPENGIRVFFPRFFEETCDRKHLTKIRQMFAEFRITLDEVRNDPDRFLMVFRPSMVESDFGGDFPPGTRCIFSRWEGYLETPEWKDVRSKLETADGQLIFAHTTGHIFAEDIVEFVNAIGPGLVVPIHTFEPEIFAAHFPQTQLMQLRETLRID
jgi:ribonuclease J